MSLAEFSRNTGVSKGSQVLYEKGNAPTVDYLAAAGDIGADIIFILSGQGGQYPDRGGAVGDPTDLNQPGMIRLPVYHDIRASAGPGAAAISEQSDSVISFDRSFLRDQGAVPEQCSVIWAKGDSMMPTIPDGSALVVDRSQTVITNGCIMVIGVGDDLLVKRIRRRIDGQIDLISDNSAYAPETLGPDSLHHLRVIGRVVYFGRTP